MSDPLFSTQHTAHGVFLEVLDLGVLLTGKSGIGKSEVALSLIARTHKLIADDSVEFTRLRQHSIIGNCPPLLQDFLEVRGLGILNIRAMFGDEAIQSNKKLTLIVHLIEASQEELATMDRLAGMHCEQQILGVDIPQVSIPVAPGRNIAILVEAAVRNQQLRQAGYEACKDFTNRQLESMTLKNA